MFKFTLNVNKIIKHLIIADTIYYSAVGMVTPIIAIFYVDYLKDSSLAVAGIAASIFLFIRGICQIPLAMLIDKLKGEYDDYWFMITGTVLMSLTYFLYVFANTSSQIYIIEAIHAVGYSIMYPSWSAIFSRHLDKEKESFEWSLYSTLVSFGSAIMASVGVYIVSNFGFRILFVVIGIFTLLSNIILLMLFDRFLKPKKVE